MKLVDYLKLIWRNNKGKAGLIITVFFILLGTVGPLIVPKPVVVNINPNMIFRPPMLSPEYILGTGPLGCSILGDIVWGAPFILEVSFLAGLFTTLIGITVGMVAGYIGGIVDNVLMSINDIVMTMPSLILILILATSLKTTNPFILAGILSISGWTGLARAIRSQILLMKNLPYVEVSRILGLGSFHIIFREIMPTIASYIAIHFIFNVEGALYASVGLYFLGILPVSQYNWGVMINEALQDGGIYGNQAFWYLFWPSFFVVMFMFGLIMLSYGIDEISNPRLRRV
ncbi:ABC transporter permease [Stygiolobus caldivivus]|uniref:Peptide ABC transporter permease n=1 Tax=Stygiolobus caldivivus TaxID=2824673 RepID=A0A8D5ZJ41_9CREN|nr:ABC transporter permease [Stygiolobus caldivivus]BCU69960.1 peptide ABC transporter permease [Stygiolobus caldivivus]